MDFDHLDGLQKKNMLSTLVGEGMYGPCERYPANKIGCRTSYSDNSLNKSPILCRDCEDAYNEYWDDMWNEYWSDRL